MRSARYAGEKASDEDNNKLLLHNMKFQVKRTCRFRCALCVAQPDGKVLNEVDGICDGMLLHEPLGENGFGYDPLFWSTELHKGMAEATMQEKNKSAIAVRQSVSWLLSGAKRNENRHYG